MLLWSDDKPFEMFAYKGKTVQLFRMVDNDKRYWRFEVRVDDKFEEMDWINMSHDAGLGKVKVQCKKMLDMTYQQRLDYMYAWRR